MVRMAAVGFEPTFPAKERLATSTNAGKDKINAKALYH